MAACPVCHCENTVKNSHIHNGKQRFKCKECGRHFVEAPVWRRVPEETKALIDRMLLERISLAGIARVLSVSESWLQEYVNGKFAAPPVLEEAPAKKGATRRRK